MVFGMETWWMRLNRSITLLDLNWEYQNQLRVLFLLRLSFLKSKDEFLSCDHWNTLQPWLSWKEHTLAPRLRSLNGICPGKFPLSFEKFTEWGWNIFSHSAQKGVEANLNKLSLLKNWYIHQATNCNKLKHHKYFKFFLSLIPGNTVSHYWNISRDKLNMKMLNRGDKSIILPSLYKL